MIPKPRAVIITGPTGAGKSDLAIQLARDLGGQIINADSLAFYRGFNIGTAKPGPADLALAPHHLIDLLEPDQDFDAALYLKIARPIIERLHAEGRPALVTGGAGFYLRGLTGGLFEGPGRDPAFRAALAREAARGVDLHARLAAVDPESAARLAPADRVRIERALEVFHLTGRPISAWQREHGLADRVFDILTIVADRPPEELRERLARRTEQMFAAGLAAEVADLLARGWSPELKPFKSIGYKETVAYVRGETTLAEARAATLTATRRLSKRQRTWFRGQMPDAHWVHPDEYARIVGLVKAFYGSARAFGPGCESQLGAEKPTMRIAGSKQQFSK